MKKKNCMAVALLLGLTLRCVADIAFVSFDGDWGAAGNWDLGRLPVATDQMKVNSDRKATIQSNTVAIARNMLVGNNGAGTVVVKGSLDTAWNDIKLGVWGSGNGTLKVLGGTVGSPTQRQKTVIGEGSVGTSDRGTLQIGDGTLGGTYYTDNLYMFNSSGMTGSNLIEVQGGTLDAVGKTINVGYASGTASTALMQVGNTASVRVGNLVIGNNGNGTSGSLAVNGSGAVFDISGGFTLSEGSRLEMVFDSNGISTLIANKFWFGGSAVMDVVGTSGLAAGRYDLVTGLTGGSGTNLAISVSGFNGCTVEILTDTSGGQLTYYANIVPDPRWSFAMGACEQQLFWLEGGDLTNQFKHLDAMSEAGAGWIRLVLQKPFEPNLIGLIQRCNELGIKVLMVVGTSSELFPPGTERRPGNRDSGGVAWDSYRLSDLDHGLSEQFMRDFFSLLQSSNATISAIEMFNEINWNAFNGDLPLVDGGMWIDASTPWNDPVFEKYREGLLNVAQLTKTTSELNDELLGGEAKIITSGLVGYYTKDSNWVASVQGVLVSQDLTLQLMHGSNPQQGSGTNYLQYVAGIGMHVYPASVDIDPQTAEGTALAQIAADLDPALGVPGVGTTRPYWITETGYRRSKFGYDETNRLEQLSFFYDALTSYDRPKSAVAAAFHYAFSAELDANAAVWENRSLLKSADIFKVTAEENTTWTNYPFEAWQVEYFGDQAHNDLVAGSVVDFDGDGIVNLYEYTTGGSPIDPLDMGYILQIEPESAGNGLQVLYAARTNDSQIVFNLEWSDCLMSIPIWEPVSETYITPVGPLLGSAVQMFTFDEVSPVSNRFFRFRVTHDLNAD